MTGMRWIVLAALAGLTACGSEPASDAPAPDAAVTATAPIATPVATPSPSPAVAAGEIPARFRGVWDAVTGTCDAASDMRVEIAARRIEYYESVGAVSGVRADGEDAIVELAMEGEGESWEQASRLALQSTPDGERLRITDASQPARSDGPLRKRCAA